MTLSTRIAPHLPYLRRYSRALTGTQTSGDAYVAAVLEAIIADLSIFPDTANDRVALYKLFTQLFGSTAVQIPEPTSPYAWEQRATLNLSKVSPRARQAFLLASVENFRVAEIAEILETEEQDVMKASSTGGAMTTRVGYFRPQPIPGGGWCQRRDCGSTTSLRFPMRPSPGAVLPGCPAGWSARRCWQAGSFRC